VIECQVFSLKYRLLILYLIVKKHQKDAAAHARAVQHNQTKSNINNMGFIISNMMNNNDDDVAEGIHVNSDSDCGHMGGVEYHESDSEYEPDTNPDDDQSDDESIAEYESDELKDNLYKKCQ
jgi:hypothetical protein